MVTVTPAYIIKIFCQRCRDLKETAGRQRRGGGNLDFFNIINKTLRVTAIL